MIGAVLVGCLAEEASEPKKTFENAPNVEVKSKPTPDEAGGEWLPIYQEM
ncbi:hypothetical protein ACFQWC_13500 [Rossellomorea sp. GCM10028870]